MSSAARQLLDFHLITRGQITVAAGDTYVLGVGGCGGFTAIFGAGTHSYQPCDKDGTVVPDSTAANFLSEDPVEVAWSHYLITADAGEPCIVCSF